MTFLPSFLSNGISVKVCGFSWQDGVTEEVGGPAVGGGAEVGGRGRLGVQRVEE
jgi:hypothetical protein